MGEHVAFDGGRMARAGCSHEVEAHRLHPLPHRRARRSQSPPPQVGLEATADPDGHGIGHLGADRAVGLDQRLVHPQLELLGKFE